MNVATVGWKIVPKDSWKAVVAEYSDRMAAIRKLDPWNVTIPHEGAEKLPTDECIFSSSGDPHFLFVLRRLGLFACGQGGVALQVSQIVVELWEHGQFIVVPLNTRFIVECWGRIHYAKCIAENVLDGGDLDKAAEKMERLTFGTRSEAHLPWGGTHSELKSIHLNDCLRSLSDVEPEIMESYDFLSESSHPSFTENTYFQFAGPPMSNWDNKAYEKIMRPLLDRCFHLFEQAVSGIVKDMTYFIALNQVVEKVKTDQPITNDP